MKFEDLIKSTDKIYSYYKKLVNNLSIDDLLNLDNVEKSEHRSKVKEILIKMNEI